MGNIKMAAMESGGAWGLAAITKFGWIKLASLGAALIGAGLMAMSRPPKTRKEQFYQATTALGSSLLLGDFAVRWAATFFSFVNLATDSYFDILTFYVTIHGLVGAMAWGLFGALGTIRDKIAKDPIGTVKDVKDISSI